MKDQEGIRRGQAIMDDMQRMGFSPAQIEIMTKISTGAANDLRQVVGQMMKDNLVAFEDISDPQAFQNLVCGIAFLVLHNAKLAFDAGSK